MYFFLNRADLFLILKGSLSVNVFLLFLLPYEILIKKSNKLWYEAQPNPPPPDFLTPVVWAMAGDNKQFDLRPTHPFTRIDWKLNHSTPSLKISCKSVQPFSRNVADKETKKEIARLQYPVPLQGAGW